MTSAGCNHGYGPSTTYVVLGYGLTKGGQQTTRERCSICFKHREMTGAQHLAAQRLLERGRAVARARGRGDK